MNAIDPKMSRRSFVAATAAAGGALVLGFHLPDRMRMAAASNAGAEVNAWILIYPDDTVVIRVARSEMGQGSFTALPMLVAEELECDWSKVKAEYASFSEHLKRNRVFVTFATGGSRSIRDSQSYLRIAGATAREMLVAAAAKRWNVAPGECRAANSVVTHASSGRTLRYGEIAAEAAALPAPKETVLKSPAEWKIVGKPIRRFDVPDKVMGKPIYGIDVRLSNMKVATIAQCPVFGGKLKAIDDSAVRSMGGVSRIVRLDDAVAVIADSYWQAKKALEAVKIEWDNGSGAASDSESIRKFLRDGLDSADARPARREGDALAQLAKAGSVIEAEYEAPFLNHATMEPMNATALVTPERVEVWVSTQNGEGSAATAAAAANVPLAKVEVHRTMLGGGFGRRGEQDYTRQAVLIAKELPGTPVKLIWSREEDMRHGRYRPVAMARHRAVLGADGRPTAWHLRISGQSIMNRVAPERIKDGVDLHFLTGLVELPYEIPNLLVDYAMRNTHVPVGFWRAVNSNQNAFFKECFIDEMAHAAKQDPYQFRLGFLGGEKARRERAVLEAAAVKAGWGKPLPPGRFRGIALHASYGSYCAEVAEISLAGGQVRLEKVTCALDTGHVVNPESVRMQIEGCIVWGLTATYFGAITIKDGAVVEGNFDDYPMLRIDRMPEVDSVLVPSGGFWGGAGEPPVPPLAPALCNAIFAATGKRIRSLPLTKHGLVKA